MTTAPHRESTIESYLKEQAARYGVLAMKFTSPGLSGVPDQILVGATADGVPRTVFVEVKRPGETRRALQYHVAQLINDHHGFTTAVDSHTTVDVMLQWCFGPQSQAQSHVPQTFIAEEKKQLQNKTQKDKPRHRFSFPQP